MKKDIYLSHAYIWAKHGLYLTEMETWCPLVEVCLTCKEEKNKGSSNLCKQNLVPATLEDQSHHLFIKIIASSLSMVETSFPYGSPWLSNSLNEVFSTSLFPVIEVLKSFHPSLSALPDTLNFTYIYPPIYTSTIPSLPPSPLPSIYKHLFSAHVS